jgi:hypothetical protein
MFDYLFTPFYLDFLFAVTVLTTLYLFYLASRKSRAVLLVCLGWLFVQSAVSISGFYADTLAVPPRFLFAVVPPVLLIVYLFVSREGRRYIDSLNLRMLTDLHVVRALVEVVLWRLYIESFIPELMTFEGRNFDILAGITAPLVGFFAFRKGRLNKALLLTWNVLALFLVLHIVVNAVLSAPTPFQQFAFDQPNIAVLYFPYALLPGFVVPVVVFSHLAALRQLLVSIKLA